MSQVSYGTITITDTTDLTTYIRYAKKTPLTAASDFQETPTTDTHFIAVLSIPSTNNIPAWNSSDWKWSEFIGTDGLSVKSTRTLYYLKTNSTAVPQVNNNTSIVSTDVQNAWTSKNPTYVANGTYWTCLEVTLSDNTTKSWSVPTEDLGLTQAAKDAAIANSIAQQTIEDAQGAMSQAASAVKEVKRIWFVKATNTSQAAPTTGVTSGSSSTYNAWSTVKPIENSAYPYYFYCDQTLTNGGLYSWSEVLLEADPYTVNALNVRTQNFFKGKDTTYDGWFASGRSENSGLNVADANTYYYNARFGATHITLGYNKTPVIDLNGAGGSLDIYRLPTISGTSVTPGTLGVKLNGTTLNFYNTNGTLTSSFGDTISLASNGASITIGSSQNEHINIDTNGLKIYGNYSYNNNGTSASMYGLLGSFGDSVQIGPSNTGHITLNTTGATFYDSAHTTIGVIGNTDLYYSAESYEEIVEVNWVSNETFTYDKQFDYDTIINSILIAIKNGDNIDWSSAQTATSPWGTVYINLGETMVPISISPSAVTGRTNCVFSSTDINPITDTILAFKINHTPSMPGPHYSFGIGSIASGTGSFAAGVGIQAVGPYQMALGRYNKKDLDASFIIGNGSGDNNRSNLFVVDKEGNLSVKDGFKIVNDSDNFIELTTNAINFYNNQISIASFGADGVQIGKENETHLEMDYRSLQLIDLEGDYYLYISDRRNSNGVATLEVNFLGDGETTQFDVGVDMSTLISAVDSSNPSNVGSINATTSRYLDFQNAPANGAQVTITFTTTDQGAKAYTLGTRDTANDVLGASSVVLNRLNVASGPDSCASGYYTVASGNNAHSEGLRTTASGANSHAEGYNTIASGYNSHAEGGTLLVDGIRICTTASGLCSHAEGAGTTASNSDAHAEGEGTTASGLCSHAEGYNTIASGHNSHAEGGPLNTNGTIIYTTASGLSSHAEGVGTTASKQSSHAEGTGTIASEHSSHAEGYKTTASGYNSHAQNKCTIAQRRSQTTLGEYNITDTAGADETVRGDYAVIVGNGTADTARSNALTVDWNGRITIPTYITSTWIAGRDNARLRLYPTDTISSGHYHPYISMKGSAGTWDIGTYTNGVLTIGHATDTDYDANPQVNQHSGRITIDTTGNIVITGNITDGSGNVLANKKVDFSNAFNGSNIGYTVTVASLAGSTYLGQAIELGSIVNNKYPLFNGFDILGSGTARIHTLGHYVYKDNNKWYAFVKMRNDNTSAITNFTVTAYIAWITI